MLTCVFHLKVLETPRTIFYCYYPGHFHVVCAMKNLRRLFIFSRGLKSDKIEGVFLNEQCLNSGVYRNIKEIKMRKWVA